MIDFRLFHAAVYRSAQETTWQNPFPYICLQVSGLRWRRTTDGPEDLPPLPFLELVGAGRRTSFHYGADRENWVIQLITDDIANAPDRERCDIRSQGTVASIPARIPLSEARCRHWQRHCARLVADSLSPDPLRILRVRAGVCDLLAAFIAASDGGRPDDPAERLRLAIDGDQRFIHTLEALGAGLGYGNDHLRRRFVERFGMTPMQYRMHRRMAIAADLIATGRDDLKTIAERLGFRHSSHFCAAYRAHFGTTPGRDLRHLRMP